MHSIMSEILTIDRIEVSPLNVRRHRAAIENLAPMEASILGSGLIQPLNIHPMRGSKDKFGAFAGGRRTRAIRNLVKRGALPVDWPVRVETYRGFSDVEIIELSLGENIPRAELELYEICAGIRALVERKETPESIAKALGQEVALVRKWHRVGQLAEPIFEAFAQGRLSADDARAFAATTDQALQLSAYEQLRELPAWQRTPEKIRGALKVGDRAAGKLLRLVGADAYRAAGGRFELDLFAGETEERGRVVDEGLLRQLADDRLTHVREQARAEVRRPDLRFVTRPPDNGYGGTDFTLQVTPRPRAGSESTLPDGDVVAWIDVSDGGEPLVTYWWESRKAKHGPAGRAEAKESGPKPVGAKALTDPYTYAQPAKAAAKEDHGVSADGLYAVRSVRREILRALIVEDAQRGGDVGRSFATWAQLRALLVREHVGLRAPASVENEAGVPPAASELARDRVQEQHAHTVWTAALKELSVRTFITEPDHAAAFIDFLNASENDRRLAGAVVAGLLLERSAAAPGFDYPAHAALALAARGTAAIVRRLWTPTAEFCALFPKGQQLAIAAEFIDQASRAKWEKARAGDVTNLLAQALQGGGHAVNGRSRPAAAVWVHPLLAFAGENRALAEVYQDRADAEQLEAAE